MHMQFDLNSVLIILAAMAGLWRTEHLNSNIISLAKEVGKLEGRVDQLEKFLTLKIDELEKRINLKLDQLRPGIITK